MPNFSTPSPLFVGVFRVIVNPRAARLLQRREL